MSLCSNLFKPEEVLLLQRNIWLISLNSSECHDIQKKIITMLKELENLYDSNIILPNSSNNKIYPVNNNTNLNDVSIKKNNLTNSEARLSDNLQNNSETRLNNNWVNSDNNFSIYPKTILSNNSEVIQPNKLKKKQITKIPHTELTVSSVPIMDIFKFVSLDLNLQTIFYDMKNLDPQVRILLENSNLLLNPTKANEIANQISIREVRKDIFVDIGQTSQYKQLKKHISIAVKLNKLRKYTHSFLYLFAYSKECFVDNSNLAVNIAENTSKEKEETSLNTVKPFKINIPNITFQPMTNWEMSPSLDKHHLSVPSNLHISPTNQSSPESSPSLSPELSSRFSSKNFNWTNSISRNLVSSENNKNPLSSEHNKTVKKNTIVSNEDYLSIWKNNQNSSTSVVCKKKDVRLTFEENICGSLTFEQFSNEKISDGNKKVTFTLLIYGLLIAYYHGISSFDLYPDKLIFRKIKGPTKYEFHDKFYCLNIIDDDIYLPIIINFSSCKSQSFPKNICKKKLSNDVKNILSIFPSFDLNEILKESDDKIMDCLNCVEVYHKSTMKMKRDKMYLWMQNNKMT
jgi:hypothetical protein